MKLENKEASMTRLDEKWQKIVDVLSFRFLPVVNPNNGELFGVEALLRDFDKSGFSSIDDVFDEAYRDGVLYDVDLEFRKIVFLKFSEIRESLLKDGEAEHKSIKLFYNLDTRILDMLDYAPGNTKQMLKEFGIPASDLFFDISERYRFSTYVNTKNILNMYKLQGFKVALDDFGSGHSGFELLYHTEPDIIKLDRFLVKNIKQHSKNRLFCAEIIKLAHIRGALVVAEGVETKEEFYTLKELGCDLMQGFFIQKPSSPKEIKLELSHIRELALEDKRVDKSDVSYILNQIVKLNTVLASTPIISVIELFQKDDSISMFPVLDDSGQPIGIVTEKSLRRYIYSQYGIQIIQNQNTAKYVSPCPIADIHTPLEELLDMFANHDELEGVIITKDFKYSGFLSAKSLLNALNEKNLKIARDQNPLTKLPGNNIITEYIQKMCEDEHNRYFIAHLDLDNFKPFNDKFGFRQGDRAIILFADTIREECGPYKPFLGHIGGDDFFVGFVERDDFSIEDFAELVKAAIKKFAQNAESFYSKEDREAGFIIAKDRYGITRKFEFLTASCAALFVGREKQGLSIDKIVELTANLKKIAKNSADKFAYQKL